MRRRYRFWLGWAGGGLLLLASPGLAQIAAPAPLMSPKLEREYTKLQAEVGRQHGSKQAETLARLAELDFDFAHDSYGANQFQAAEQHLDLASQNADRACTLLQDEANRGKTGGMKNVEISFQNIGFGLKQLAQDVRFEQRAKVQAVAAHFADLRAKLLNWMFAPKRGGFLPVRELIAPPLPVLRGGPGARAQINDPLTPAEADQVRDTSGHLDKRVPLLLQFAAARLAHFEQVRTASPRPPDRDATMYAMLRQYRAILPEFDDAVDDLAQHVTTSESAGTKFNITKVLRPVIAELVSLQAELRRIQAQSTPADLATYHFELESCLDVTSDSLQNAQEDLADATKKGR